MALVLLGVVLVLVLLLRRRRLVEAGDGGDQARRGRRVRVEAAARPVQRAGDDLVGVGRAEVVGAEVARPVVEVGRAPGGDVEVGRRAVGLQQLARGHDRVEVVIDRRMPVRGVGVVGEARGVEVRVAELLPRRHRPVGDVELHRARAAADPVEAVVGAGRGGERGLLLVDRGQQQPRDVVAAGGAAVEREEAGDVGARDLRPVVARVVLPGRGGVADRGQGRGGRRSAGRDGERLGGRGQGEGHAGGDEQGNAPHLEHVSVLSR
jgi:hypothetical protein